MSISIVIPTYDQNGYGPGLLTQLLNTIRMQKVNTDYEIAISDTATNEEIKKVCNAFDMLPIRYTRNKKSFGASENINNAISLARYDKVKLMCQDDLFAHKDSINQFAKALDRKGWAISNSVHINERGNITFRKQAAYSHLRFDKNITGMPSVIGWRKCDLRFDENLKTVSDMFFYYQLYELYGAPEVIKDYTIGQRFHANSLSRNQKSRHDTEREYLRMNNLIRC